MAQIEDVIAQLRLDVSQWQASLKNAESQMGTSTTKMSGLVDHLKARFEKLPDLISKAFISPLSVAGSIAAVGLLAKSALDYGDALLKASDQTGITVETLSALNAAAVQSDVGLEELSNSVRFLSVNMQKAIESAGNERKAFDAIGISVEQLQATSGDTGAAMELVARGMETAGSASARLARQQEILGRSSLQMTQFLKDLANQGIKGFVAEAERMGLVISRDFAVKADQFNDNLAKMGVVLKSLMIRVITPSIVEFNKLAVAIGLVRAKADDIGVDILEKEAQSVERIIQSLQTRLKLTGQGQLFEGFGERFTAQLTEAQEKLKGLQQQMAQRFTTTGPTLEQGGNEAQRQLDTLTKSLQAQRDRIGTLGAAMGKSFDAAGERVKVLRTNIEEMLKIPGVGPQTPEVQVLAKELNTLEAQIKATDEAAKQTKGLGNLGPKLAADMASIRALGQALGTAPTEIAREQISRLQSAVREFAEQGMGASAPQIQAYIGQIHQLQEALAALEKAEGDVQRGREDMDEAQRRGLDLTAQFRTETETFATTVEELTRLSKLLGVSFDETFGRALRSASQDLWNATEAGKKWQAMQEGGKQTIESLMTPIDQYNRSIKSLQDQLSAGAINPEQFERARENMNNWLHEVQQGAKNSGDALQRLGVTFSSAFENAVIGGGELSDVLKGLLEDIKRVTFRMLVLEPLMKGLSKGIESSGGLSGILGSIFKGISGIFSGGTPAVPNQHGGMFSRPTLALVAEAGSPEVVMPRHRLERYLQDMADAMQPIGGGGGVEINIINNAPNTQVTQREQQRPNGQRSIEVLIDQAVAERLQRPGSQSQQSMRAVYGVTPILKGR